MLQIENFIFSLDILDKKFKCDIPKCCGCCCLEGDAGAPLSKKEVRLLKKLVPKISKYLTKEGREAINNNGVSTIDRDGDAVTTLVDNRECAFSIVENGIYLCAIEKAWNDGVIDFQKPLSCHLFPIRMKQIGEITAVNYQKIDLCACARQLGEAEDIPVYEFLKEPLIRACGEDIYNDLCEAAKEIKKGIL